jgi:hypothetical protein
MGTISSNTKEIQDMQYKVYAQSKGALYGATIEVSEVVCNATKSKYGESIAFKRGGNGKWRAIEWLIVPDDIKTALFDKAVAKAL